ncbi:uncharacterized protein Z518_01646 [Rhinocladiella mackenziei CBS 650.93]|uniref:Zn(2)-C6 fungal-type domain-containing protein n=1 Tax=Rhinocladiella mackenziei CBS 650.93 TaxID=1442369 RepID=A0A0D2G6I4_9EURO|nr:uncharacterized protein Z518_01646 [Rhinocladiella mackenziei CBS 650.93]KIX10562.1 hypothetical protein Z518_01646 [Rhinocladiella mackenziei CBS 650.93]
MPNRKERQEIKSPTKQEGVEQSKARVRIGRACDRCKIKKSKCDGNSPCSSCVASDSTCEYSARRRREVRDWYWGMQDVMDEALQKLYWACREGRGFPGIVPEESSGRVSTDAILRGLGLHPPPVERPEIGVSQSDSVLEGVERLSSRSYRPPDVQSEDISQEATASSGQPPIVREGDDQIMLEESEPGPEDRGKRSSRIPIESEPALAPLGFSQQCVEAMDDPIEPSMLQQTNVGLMDLNPAMYQGVSAMDFQLGEQMVNHEGQTSMLVDRRPFQPQDVQGAGFASSGQAQWQDERENRQGEPLPWPGTLAAVQKHTKPKPGGSDFDV